MLAGAWTLAQNQPGESAARGPLKAGAERVFDLQSLEPYNIGADLTSGAMAAVVDGERISIGLIRIPPGDIIASHHHPNEEWLYILEGSVQMNIGGKGYTAQPGSAIYAPSNIVHGGKAGPDRELVFLAIKDTSWGMEGIKADD